MTPMPPSGNAAAAVDFYRQAFEAVERERFTTPNGQIVAEMSIDDERCFVVDENSEALNLSPQTLAGTSVRIA